MDTYGWGHGAMWIVWLLVVVGLALLFGQSFRGSWGPWRRDDDGGRRETPREILDRRYARGEITKDQYEEMKKALEV